MGATHCSGVSGRIPCAWFRHLESTMSRAHLSSTILVALASLVVLPSTVFAAGAIDITGTVSRDGVPVAGLAVTALLDGSDMIVPATTDEAGGFVLQLEGDIGGVVQIRATGPTTALPPDEQGCVTSETPTGRATVVIDALPVPPVAISLDSVLTSKVCAATASPEPAVTLPATDTTQPGQGGRGTAPGSTLGVLGLLGLVATLAALPARRRGRQRNTRP